MVVVCSAGVVVCLSPDAGDVGVRYIIGDMDNVGNVGTGNRLLYPDML